MTTRDGSPILGSPNTFADIAAGRSSTPHDTPISNDSFERQKRLMEGIRILGEYDLATDKIVATIGGQYGVAVREVHTWLKLPLDLNSNEYWKAWDSIKGTKQLYETLELNLKNVRDRISAFSENYFVDTMDARRPKESLLNTCDKHLALLRVAQSAMDQLAEILLSTNTDSLEKRLLALKDVQHRYRSRIIV